MDRGRGGLPDRHGPVPSRRGRIAGAEEGPVEDGWVRVGRALRDDARGVAGDSGARRRLPAGGLRDARHHDRRLEAQGVVQGRRRRRGDQGEANRRRLVLDVDYANHQRARRPNRRVGRLDGRRVAGRGLLEGCRPDGPAAYSGTDEAASRARRLPRVVQVPGGLHRLHQADADLRGRGGGPAGRPGEAGRQAPVRAQRLHLQEP